MLNVLAEAGYPEIKENAKLICEENSSIDYVDDKVASKLFPKNVVFPEVRIVND